MIPTSIEVLAIELDDHNSERFMEAVGEAMGKGWQLLGAIQVCASFTPGSYRYHVTMARKSIVRPPGVPAAAPPATPPVASPTTAPVTGEKESAP